MVVWLEGPNTFDCGTCEHGPIFIAKYECLLTVVPMCSTQVALATCWPNAKFYLLVRSPWSHQGPLMVDMVSIDLGQWAFNRVGPIMFRLVPITPLKTEWLSDMWFMSLHTGGTHSLIIVWLEQAALPKRKGFPMLINMVQSFLYITLCLKG